VWLRLYSANVMVSVLGWGGGVKLSVQQAMEAHRVTRSRGSHIVWAIGSQMAMTPALRTAGRSSPHYEDFWYSFLLVVEPTPGPDSDWTDYVR
jgi:hypothetical protein